MADYPYEVPEGYQQGMSGGSYNPETGARTTFALPPTRPIPPPDQFGLDSIDWNAVQENIKNHGVEEAMKATAAAIQFQGQRGYQQALKNGESAEKAITKYGPMMFYRSPQAFAPSVKALSVNVPRPESPLARERFEFQKKQPIHVGQSLYRIDASGKPIELLPAPEKPIPFVIGTDFMNRDKTVRLTPKSFSEQFSTLPLAAQTNAANLAQLKASGLSPTTNSAAPISSTPVQESSEIVVMVNPKGQKVKVPKTEIERAKKLGYK